MLGGQAIVAIALIFSREPSAIVRSRSYRFFAEPTFWLQTLGMSLCGLINLLAFAQLLVVRDDHRTISLTRQRCQLPVVALAVIAKVRIQFCVAAS